MVVAFSAFNHPLNLIVHQVGPAVAAGCPVIVKPAKAAPLSCWRFVGILREAGLPEEWCQPLLTGDDGLGPHELAGDRRVGFFSFIGSGDVGWMLRSQLAPGTRCSLEHGGVAPVIVAADADFGVMLAAVAQGRLLSCRPGLRLRAAGVCRAADRRPLADALADAARQLKVGDPDAARDARSAR